MFDADADVSSLYQQHRINPQSPPSAEGLAWRLARATVVRVVALKTATFVHAKNEIWVPADRDEYAREWAIAHELGEWHAEQLRLPAAHRERYAQAFAAAAIAPPPLVWEAVSCVGWSLSQLARTLGLTQSVAALRVGEVTGSPVALVTPRAIHTRGRGFSWPESSIVRRWAREGRDGLVREPITDDNGRAVLRSAQ